MFQCDMSTASFVVEIHKCPESDPVDAYDFRMAAGLPGGPNNRIEVPSFKWEDEKLCRAYRHLLNSEGDLVFDRYGTIRVEWWNNSLNSICWNEYSLNNHIPTVPAAAIRDYLKEQSPDTARALAVAILRNDVWTRAMSLNKQFDMTSQAVRDELVGRKVLTEEQLAEVLAIIDADSEGVWL